MGKHLLWIVLISIFTFSCSGDKSDVANNNNDTESNNGDDGDSGTITIDPNKVLSLVTDEAVGDKCPNGGLKVELGIDTNGNGILDTSEITNTDFVCNGQAGEQGPEGKSALISTEIEVAGANCKSAGVKINIGIDTNGNGVLDTNEITTENFICNGSGGNGISGGVTNLVLTGNISDEEARIKIENTVGPDTQFVIIQNTSNLTTVDLSGVAETIDIEIRNNTELASVNFPDLVTSVDKFFIIDNPKLTTIGFPVLKSVNEIQITETLVSTIEMPMLENIFGRIAISNNSNFSSFNFPSIINGDFNFSNNNQLTSINLPTLVNGSVFSFDNNNISSIDLSKMVSGSIFLTGSNLSSIDLSTFTNGSVNVSGNTISSIDLSSLVSGSVDISNTNISSLNIPLLSVASSISLNGNGNLSTINLPILEAFNSISLANNNSLINFELPLVTSIGSVESNSNNISDSGGSTFINFGVFQNKKLESFSLPQLSDITETNFNINSNASLKNIDFSSIINGTSNDIRIRKNPVLETINFSGIKSAGTIEIINNSVLVDINFSSLETVSGSDFEPETGVYISSNSSSIRTINFSSLRSITPSNFLRPIFTISLSVEAPIIFDLPSLNDFTSIRISGITSESTNKILSQLVSIVPAITGKEINISSQEPTGQGLIDADTLRSNGNSVNSKF